MPQHLRVAYLWPPMCTKMFAWPCSLSNFHLFTYPRYREPRLQCGLMVGSCLPRFSCGCLCLVGWSGGFPFLSLIPLMPLTFPSTFFQWDGIKNPESIIMISTCKGPFRMCIVRASTRIMFDSASTSYTIRLPASQLRLIHSMSYCSVSIVYWRHHFSCKSSPSPFHGPATGHLSLRMLHAPAA